MKAKLSLVSGLLLAAYIGTATVGYCQGMSVDSLTKAVAVLYPTEGNTTHGNVIFTSVPGGVKIEVNLVGLTPGLHGFHIHEYGDCSASDATSAGGHFNPGKMPHGGPTDMERHAGDLGNIEADSTGKGHYERIDKVISLNGPQTIIGRSLMVHAGRDDFKTQPTGDSGPRVACGVIGRAK